MSAKRVIADATDTPTSADDGFLLIVDRDGGGDATLTWDTDANQTWTVGDRIGVLAFDGDAIIDPAVGVNVDGSNATFTVPQGEQIVLVNADGADEWHRDGPATLFVLESLTDAKGDLWGGTADNVMGRLAVGTNDFVLTAASGETTGMKWAAAAGGGSNPPKMLDPASNGGFIPGMTNVVSFSALSMTIDTLYYVWCVPLQDETIDGIIVDVQAGAGTVLRIGVVALDTDWQPNATGLVGQTTVNPSTTGTKTVTGLAWSLSAGTAYAFLFVANGAVGLELGYGHLLGTESYSNFGGTTLQQKFGSATKASVGTSAFSDAVPDWTTGVHANNGSLVIGGMTR